MKSCGFLLVERCRDFIVFEFLLVSYPRLPSGFDHPFIEGDVVVVEKGDDARCHLDAFLLGGGFGLVTAPKGQAAEDNRKGIPHTLNLNKVQR